MSFPSKATIDAAKIVADQARSHAYECEAEVARLQIERAMGLHNITIGMKVLARQNVYVVTNVRVPYDDNEPPWLYGRVIRKDGTPGAVEHTLYDWTPAT